MAVWMVRGITMLGGVLASVGMLLVALWSWQHAGGMVVGWEQPGVAVWAVRVGAVGLAAAAQVLMMLLVVAKVYERGALASAFIICATMVFTLAAVSAVALGLAGH